MVFVNPSGVPVGRSATPTFVPDVLTMLLIHSSIPCCDLPPPKIAEGEMLQPTASPPKFARENCTICPLRVFLSFSLSFFAKGKCAIWTQKMYEIGDRVRILVGLFLLEPQTRVGANLCVWFLDSQNPSPDEKNPRYLQTASLAGEHRSA